MQLPRPTQHSGVGRGSARRTAILVRFSSSSAVPSIAPSLIQVPGERHHRRRGAVDCGNSVLRSPPTGLLQSFAYVGPFPPFHFVFCICHESTAPHRTAPHYGLRANRILCRSPTSTSEQVGSHSDAERGRQVPWSPFDDRTISGRWNLPSRLNDFKRTKGAVTIYYKGPLVRRNPP